ncbi:Hypoxia-inducible factor 1-alpha [Mactra antiquata]
MPYRNSEKRKEKSRDAARCRRGKEAEIFTELASQLPLSSATIDTLDKASVMRLLLSTLKVKSVLNKRPKLEMPEIGSMEEKIDTYYPKALEGFLIIFSKEGDIIYVSESVCKVLGMQQIDLMGQSIYEFSHPCDHDEIQEVIDPNDRSDEREASKTVFIRMKCTLTSKGRNVNLKSATYKVIRLSGRYVPDDLLEEMENTESELSPNDVHMRDADDDYESDDEDNARVYKPQPLPHFLAIGEAIRHPSNIEVPLDKRTFISRHSMNMRFTHCDERIHRLIGYQSDEMINQSFYLYPHATDSKMMEKAFKDLFAKGQVSTGQYRFLAKNGGYVWMVSEATVIFNNRSQKPDYVVCVHYVLSHVEQHGRVLSEVQLPAVTIKKEITTDSPCEAVKSTPPVRNKQTSNRASRCRDVKVADVFHVPTFSTEAVFGEKTDDMEEDYLYPRKMKKSYNNKYDNLNQLTSSPDSEDHVSIDIPTFDSAKLGDQYTRLTLFDEGIKMDSPLLHSGDHLRDPHLINSLNSTPDSTMSGTPSPVAHFRTINPNDISAMKDIFTTLDPPDENKEIDFTMRAPYIPMNPEEDFALCQPSSDSFLSMGADFNPGIFGSTESVINLRDELYDGPPPEKKTKTAIDMLDGSTVKKSIDRPQDQMLLKMKRPLDRSCLERGPPLKMSKYVKPGQSEVSRVFENASKSGSVLMNLLMNGEDLDNGYSVNKKNISRRASGDFIQHLLSTVTSHDIEANLPTTSAGYLLQGQDLMAALNMNLK